MSDICLHIKIPVVMIMTILLAVVNPKEAKHIMKSSLWLYATSSSYYSTGVTKECQILRK